jgi:hypothetical protein
MALPEMKEKTMLEETAAQLDDIYTSEYISLYILCGLVGSRNLILMPHTSTFTVSDSNFIVLLLPLLLLAYVPVEFQRN